MFEITDHIPLIILIVGILIFLSISIKTFFHRFYLAPIAGFIALGWLLRLSEAKGHYLPKGIDEILGFLGEIGIITILFHIGLESRIQSLIDQLRRASFLAISNIIVSGSLAFSVSYYVLSIALLPSLFIGVALTATSLGVVVTIWRESRAIESKNGQLLIDLTALDDIIAILLMALLLAVAPLVGKSDEETIAWALYYTFSLTVFKLLFFLAICLFFSKWLEPNLVKCLRKFERSPDPLVTMMSVAFVIAGVAGLLEFSLALGAFFAGLAFSRDPKAVQVESPIKPIESFFAPFFFIHIGFQVFPGVLAEASLSAGVLILVAVAGKVLGVFLPAQLCRIDMKSSILLGISMIPRAEVALVVMLQGVALGSWAVPPAVYASVVLVSFVTCLITPIVLKPLLMHCEN